MTWIVFTFIAVAAWTVSNFLDRHTMSQEYREPVFGIFVSSCFSLTIGLCAILYAKGAISTVPAVVCFALAVGILTSLSNFCYYSGFRDGRLSEVGAVFTADPIFALLIGVALLHERVTLPNILGIFIILFGVGLANVSRMRKSRIATRAVLFGLGVAVSAAMIAYFVKLAAAETPLSHILIWIGIGEFATSTFLMDFHGVNRKKWNTPAFKRAFRYLLMSDVSNVIATLAILLAYTQGPMSLIMPLIQIKTVLLFIGALVLGRFAPKFIKEPMTRNEIIKKSFAAIITFAGAYLVIGM